MTEVKTLKEKKAGRKYMMASVIMAAATMVMIFPLLLTLAGIANLVPLISGGRVCKFNYRRLCLICGRKCSTEESND